MENEMKYHIEKNTVQETLIIPLLGRLVCSERFPQLFSDPERQSASATVWIMISPRSEKRWKALPDVIAVRNELLPAGAREENIACDLNDLSWMDRIDASGGAIFFAAGVFYYFKTEDLKTLFSAMASRFPGAVLTFDACNRRGAKLMRKTWLKEAGITDVGAYFSLEDESELNTWSDRFASVTAKSYMRGYRDIYRDVGAFHKLMLRVCDSTVKMKIVRIRFQ